VGQGALAVETRADGGAAEEIARRLEHRDSRIAVTAERAVLRALGGGCQVPIGAYATVDGDVVELRAIIVSPDGTEIIGKHARGASRDAATIGRALGEELLSEGGRQILEAVYGAA
jgi:hydroxymethylbilane synthase